jgi:hypothetical protein
MSQMEESVIVRKTRLMTQLLLISVTLNVGLLATFLYRSLAPHELAAHVPPEKVFEVSNGEMIYSYFHCSFDELVAKLGDERLVEEGYRVCDLALACLVSYHHFDLDRALPTTKTQSRHLLFVHAEGGEQIDVPVFPGLSMEDFSVISLFAKRESWPLTAKGLFLELARSQDENLRETFMLSSPFITAQTLFNREGFALCKEEILALLQEGEWQIVKRIHEEKVFTREQQLSILSALVDVGSKRAVECLLTHEREYALRKLPDKTLAKLVSHTEDEGVLKEVASGVRCDGVRDVAAEKLGSPVEDDPKVHVVQKGDTLWDIARKYKVSMKRLQELNQLKDQNHLFPGKKLVLNDAP